jgi:hypothetical protein
MIQGSTYSINKTCLTIALLVFAGIAHANTVLVPTGVDWNRGERIWIYADGADQQLMFAGVIDISVWQNGQQYDRDTLCVDLFTEIILGEQYASTVLHPASGPAMNLEQVSWLVDNALMPTQGPVYTSALDRSNWVTSAAQGAGLQLAIWDITTDGGDGFFSGRVQVSTSTGHGTDSAALGWAQTYEALSSGQQSNTAYVYQTWNPTTLAPAQMLEGPMFPDGGPSPNPEPATMALAGAALLGLGLAGRKQRSKLIHAPGKSPHVTSGRSLGEAENE